MVPYDCDAADLGTREFVGSVRSVSETDPELGQKGEVSINGRMQNTTKATMGTEKARYG